MDNTLSRYCEEVSIECLAWAARQLTWWSACDIGEAMQSLESEQSPFRRFSYVTPQMSRVPSFASATSHLILQPFRRVASPTSPGGLPMMFNIIYSMVRKF